MRVWTVASWLTVSRQKTITHSVPTARQARFKAATFNSLASRRCTSLNEWMGTII